MKAGLFVISFISMLSTLAFSNDTAPPSSGKNASVVKIVGAMKEVMWNGRLAGVIDLDTISNKKDLYGLGPKEGLAGEILVIDGKSYLASVAADSTLRVEETFKLKAPFFVYANVSAWKTSTLPDSIRTLSQFERFLEHATRNIRRPFAFKLSGSVERAMIHVVNLPAGAQVRSPEDAHKGEIEYPLSKTNVVMVGFFSTEHQGVFTHHDSFVHIHLLTDDKTRMGHLDAFEFAKGPVTLFLPQE